MSLLKNYRLVLRNQLQLLLKQWPQLVKTQGAGPPPQSFRLVGLGWSLRICISRKVPGDVDIAGSGITF